MAVDLEANQVAVQSFSGGMTDFVFNGEATEFELGENFLLTPDEKLFTRPGSDINSASVYQIPAGNQRVGSLFSFEETLFVQSARSIYTAGASWGTLTGPTGNPAIGVGTTANYIAKAYWNRHIYVVSDSFAKPVKLFATGVGAYTVRTAGLPALATTPTALGTVGTDNYVYAFTYFVSYVIDGVTFEDESAVTLLEVPLVNEPSVNTVAISAIPVLGNGSTDNYDTTNVKVRIYRTEKNETLFYRVAEISNGTTSYNDTMSDATLITNPQIYTTGDVVENDTPPPAKYIHVVQGIAFYGHVKEGTQVMKNRVRQSIPDDPDSVPATFYVDLDQEVRGLSSFGGNPIAFTDTKIYRIDGIFDELGRGGMTAVEISETIGALNHNSIVQTKDGVFFAGNDGFYFTDSFKIQRISRKLVNTFKDATRTQAQRDAIQGTYDKKFNRVYWTMRKTTASADNDILFVLDLNFGIRDNSSFTTWVGGASFAPTAIVFHDDILRRGDSRGYLLRHEDTLLTDPKINTAVAPTSWSKQTIIYDYKSVFSNFGMPQIRKWVSRVLSSLRNISNVSLQISSNNDDTNVFMPLVEIKDTSQISWGDPNGPDWGVEQCLWNYFKLIEEERRFPKGKLRCSYKQIRMTNAYTLISSSEVLGVAAVDATAKTATLTGANIWPSDSIDYFVSFASDGFVKQYLVTAQAGDELTFADADDASVDAAASAWKLKGYAKGEVLHLLGYIIYFSPISKTFQAYRGAS